MFDLIPSPIRHIYGNGDHIDRWQWREKKNSNTFTLFGLEHKKTSFTSQIRRFNHLFVFHIFSDDGNSFEFKSNIFLLLLSLSFFFFSLSRSLLLKATCNVHYTLSLIPVDIVLFCELIFSRLGFHTQSSSNTAEKISVMNGFRYWDRFEIENAFLTNYYAKWLQQN